MIKISVIIPVFNDASHIRRCIESVCNQTIADKLEIIIVDDGSTDGSIDIAKHILGKHLMLEQSKFIIFDINHGVANARKAGINAAEGEFIQFCDSDDWMEKQMCELMLNKAETDKCDIVVCDYYKVEDNKIEAICPCYRENFLQQLLLCSVTGSLWNKLIRISLLRRADFRFPVHDFSEDYVYCLQCAIYSNKIGYVPNVLYNYLKRHDSLVRCPDPEKKRKRHNDDMANFKLDLEIMQYNNLIEKFREEIIAHKLKMKNSNKNNLSVWKATFPELDKEIWDSRYVSLRSKCSYWARRLKCIL